MIIGIIAIVIGIIIVVRPTGRQQTDLVTPWAERNVPTNIFRKINSEHQDKEVPPPPPINNEQLKANVEKIINQDSGYWAVVSGPLDKPDILINEKQVFTAASLMKVLVAEYALSQVEQGTLALDQNIEGKTVEEHLRLMVNRSDNDSWYTLNDYFTYTKLQIYAKDRGLTGTNVYKNTITAVDMNKLLADLYRQRSLNKESSHWLLKLMQNTESEDRIPPAFPENTILYHKAGMWEGAWHDAAIIETPQQGTITLVILSQNSPQAVDVIRKIAEEVAEEYWKNR